MLDFEWGKFLTWNFSEAVNHPAYGYSILLLIFLCFFLFLVRKLRTELIHVFSDEEGNVQITPNALHELVRKSCDGIPGIFSPATSIIRKGQNFRLNVRIHIRQDCNIKETRLTLQKEIESTLIENLSFTNFDGTDVVIKGFQGKT